MADSSSMLENAILDASALKEVAIKNAEATLLEKYSNQIKEAVDSILEQDEDLEDTGDLGDVGGDLGGLGDIGGEEGGEPSKVADSVPLAATEGESLCPCAGEDEEIEIDFGELEKQMSQEDEGGESEEEGSINIDVGSPEEEMELDEEDVNSILEDLKVDLQPVKTGWKDSSAAKAEENMDKSLAMQQDDEEKEESEKLKTAMKGLEESLQKQENKYNSLLKEMQEIKEKNKKYESLLIKAKDSLQESNTVNTVLLYKNKVLEDSSLNERQKKVFVESLTKSNSIEEAKVIYETLQNSVGSSSNNKKKPESLNEVAQKNKSSISILGSRKEVKKASDPSMDRMQLLAGIKTSNKKEDN